MYQKQYIINFLGGEDKKGERWIENEKRNKKLWKHRWHD